MASPVSLRLDEKTRSRIERIARRRRVPASQVLREAIVKWVEAEEGGASTYDLVADLIGVAHGGDPALSTNTGRRFVRLLRDLRNKRDSADAR